VADIEDLYQLIFGRINIRDGSVVEMAEHGRVGGLSTGAGFKRVVNIDPATGQAVGATVSVLGSIDATQAGLWYVNQSGPWIVNASIPNPIQSSQFGNWFINATVYGNFGTATTLTDVNLTKVAGATVSLGQQSMANSLPVVLAIDQSQVPVTQSGLWNVNATVDGSIDARQSGIWSINATVYGNLTALVSLPGEVEIKNDAGNPIPTYLTTFPSLTVLSNQGGNWTVNASVPNGVSVTNTVPVSQSGAWNVTATIGNVLSAAITSFPSLTVTALQGIPPWFVMATILNAQPVAISSLPSLTVIANQGGVWNVFATVAGMLTARAEDSAHTTADFGQFILGVRNDFASLATLTSTNMDYSPFAVDDKGRMEIAQSIGALANGVETTVTGTAIAILNANVNRTAMIIQNTGAANVRIGVAGVTATTGFRLASGESVTFTNPFVPTATMTAIREGATNTTIFTMEET